jgi:hypothetical protein
VSRTSPDACTAVDESDTRSGGHVAIVLQSASKKTSIETSDEWRQSGGSSNIGRKTFTQEFDPVISQGPRHHRQPVLIAETSVIPGKDAARQVAGLFTGIRADSLIDLV